MYIGCIDLEICMLLYAKNRIKADRPGQKILPDYQNFLRHEL